jgi:hypothetical protein
MRDQLQDKENRASRVWRKVKGDWDAWNGRSLKDEPIIRLILDGTIVRVRLDKKATSISLGVMLDRSNSPCPDSVVDVFSVYIQFVSGAGTEQLTGSRPP